MPFGVTSHRAILSPPSIRNENPTMPRSIFPKPSPAPTRSIAQWRRTWPQLSACAFASAMALSPSDARAQIEVQLTGAPAPGLEAFDRVVFNVMQGQYGAIPSAALAVTYHGRLVLAHGYSLGQVAPGSQTQPQSLFRIASLSKPLTSTLINRLIEKHFLSLDNTLGQFVDLTPPAGMVADPRLATITVRNLLEHLSGLGTANTIGYDPMFHDASIAQALGISLPIDRSDIIEFMSGVPLAHDPGTFYDYSNYGYLLLGRVIEAVTGMSYASYAQSVMAPIGLCDLHQGHSLASARLPGEVEYDSGFTLPTVMDNSGEIVGAEYGGFHLENMDSHGAWVTSAVSLVRFLSNLDNPNAPNALLDQTSADRMFSLPQTYQQPYQPGNPYYSEGWLVRDWGGGQRHTWHDGSLPSTTAYVVRAEEDGWDYAILLNRRDENDTGAVQGWIDNQMWAAFNGITQWPAGDQFTTITPDAIFHSDIDGDDADGNSCQRIAVQPVLDPSMERTSENAGPNLYWSSTDSRNGGTVFYEGSNVPALTGIWAAWFGGWGPGDEEWQYFWQTIAMPSTGPSYLNFWMYLSQTPDADAHLQASIDDGTGNVTCSIQYDLAGVAPGTGYVQKSYDISSCAGAEGAPRRVIFTYHHAGTGSDGSIFIDGVSIDRTAVSSVAHDAAPASAPVRPPLSKRSS